LFDYTNITYTTFYRSDTSNIVKSSPKSMKICSRSGLDLSNKYSEVLGQATDDCKSTKMRELD